MAQLKELTKLKVYFNSNNIGAGPQHTELKTSHRAFVQSLMLTGRNVFQKRVMIQCASRVEAFSEEREDSETTLGSETTLWKREPSRPRNYAYTIRKP